MSTVRALALSASLAAVAAASPADPLPDLQAVVADESKGSIELVRFRKLVESEEAPGIVVRYIADIAFKRDGEWQCIGLSRPRELRVEQMPDFSGIEGNLARRSAQMRWRTDYMGKPVSAGETATIVGELSYTRGADGWTFKGHSYDVPLHSDPWAAAEKAFGPGGAVAVASAAPEASAAPLTDKQRRRITNTLRQLVAAAEQHMLSQGVARATYADIVGPGKFVISVDPTAGEDYTGLLFEAGREIAVTTANGERVSVKM